MSWKAEHGKDYEVPSLIEFMVKKGILKDISWHNDTMPRFIIEDPENEENGVCIWVDHPLGSKREAGPGPRFGVMVGPLGSEADEEDETDDLEEAINTALEYAEKHYPSWHPIEFDDLVDEWKKSVR